MSNNTYILCPGQGAQAVGMGKDFYESSPSRRTSSIAPIASSDSICKDICFNGPEDGSIKTDISQPAIYVTSVACLRRGSRRGSSSTRTTSPHTPA